MSCLVLCVSEEDLVPVPFFVGEGCQQGDCGVVEPETDNGNLFANCSSHLGLMEHQIQADVLDRHVTCVLKNTKVSIHDKL